LEYVDAVLLDERSSLNSDRIFNFLLAFFPKVSDQVLNEQMQTIIADLSKTFQEQAPNLPLSRAVAVKQLNGDLRALLLVNTARPDHLTPTLHAALRLLKGRVEAALSSLESSSPSAEVGPGQEASAGEGPSSSAPSDSPVPPKRPRADLSAEDKARLADAFSLCLKTLKLLVEMCENKVKVQESAAALVKSVARQDREDEDDDEEEESSKESTPGGAA
jgi:hypothetical protein